jgi:hypothetical protein
MRDATGYKLADMGNLTAVRLGSAVAGFGAFFLLGALLCMRLIMHLEVGTSGSALISLTVTASALVLPALVLAVMTVWPTWPLRSSDPATKYQFPAVLAFLWLVVAFWISAVLLY